MGANKRTAFQRDADLERTSDMYLKGKKQHEIADIVGLSRTQIAYDLKIIRQRWVASSIRNFDEERGIALAKIDVLERTYWDAWIKSCKEKTRKSIQQNPFGDKTSSVMTETMLGNPAYLQGVERCIEQRRKILGLDAPTRTELTGRDGGAIRTEDVGLTVEERMAKLAAIFAAAQTGGGAEDSGAAGQANQE